MSRVAYWNHKKGKVSYLECETEEEANTVRNVMERNGWFQKNGIWHYRYN